METYENLTIFTNASIDEVAIKKIDPSYVIDKKYPLNKTVVFKGTYVFPLDILLKDAVVVLTEKIAPVFGELLLPLMNYLTSTIKTICTVDVANEMGFRLTIYTPQSLPMNDNPYFTKYTNTKDTGILGEKFMGYMTHYALHFKFSQDWMIIQNKVPEEGIRMGPCFPPIPGPSLTINTPTPTPSWNSGVPLTPSFQTQQPQSVFSVPQQPQSVFSVPQQPQSVFSVPQQPQSVFSVPQQPQNVFSVPQQPQNSFSFPLQQPLSNFSLPQSAFGTFGARK
jgi:hypothetical protein